MPYKNIEYENGDVYTGVVDRQDIPHGKGKMQFNNGALYDGDFRYGQPNGAGTFVSPEGAKYIGSFRLGIPEGYGEISYPNGGRYEGEWQHGKIHGKGIFSFPDGNSYEGRFENGRREGRGVFCCTNGTRIEQRYLNGKLTEESDTTGLPVITITDECKKYGYWHHIVCRFVAKVGEFKYTDMQIIEYDPWDCDEGLARTFKITEVTDEGIKFIYNRRFSESEPEEEMVFRGELGVCDKHEVRIGGMSLLDFNYKQEARLTVSCE